MATLGVSTTANLLVIQYGSQAGTYAKCQALEDFMNGDLEASEEWERVSTAVETLLQSPAVARSFQTTTLR